MSMADSWGLAAAGGPRSLQAPAVAAVARRPPLPAPSAACPPAVASRPAASLASSAGPAPGARRQPHSARLTAATAVALAAAARPHRLGRRARGSSNQAEEASGDGKGGAKESFPAHLRSSEIASGLKSGKFVQGELRMMKNTCYLGSVSVKGEELVITGSLALNRAMDTDIVVVERLDALEAEAYEAAAKRVRHRVTGGAEALSEAEANQQAMETGGDIYALGGGKSKGKVVSIVQRRKRTIVGSIMALGAETSKGPDLPDEGDRLFVPADRRFPYVIVKPPADAPNFEGKRVAVTVHVWDRFMEYPRGQWASVLGDVGDVEVETMMILEEHNIRYAPFSEEVLACLPPADFKPGPKDMERREDFRGVLVFSIDPPNCEDIDDALSCELLPNGNFRVGVHIADVTHFLHAGSAMDMEAADRCTSVYLVDRRIDMLPRLLTTDICSLRAGGDRLTFSAIFEITPDATVLSERFCKSVIHSRAALSYGEAQQRLDGEIEEDSEITKAIKRLNALAVKLRARRIDNGAIELASEERIFERDSETGLPTNMLKYKTYDTNSLIEEFMLLANHAVAVQICSHFRKLSVLRRHDTPKEKPMEDLRQLLECLGMKEFEWKTNKALAKSLNKVQDPYDPFFNRLVRLMTTRCMQEALYFCTGDLKPDKYAHFGLAMSRYTHFTSPIRRYADVIVHRFLAASLGLTALPEVLQDRLAIADQVARMNLRNRMARWADAASSDFHLYLYFKNREPVVAEGIVVRLDRLGLQVCVEEYGAEGIAELSPLDWLLIQERHTAHGRPLSPFEGITIGIFDKVTVSITADLSDGRHRKLKLVFIGIPRPTYRSTQRVLTGGAALDGPLAEEVEVPAENEVTA